MTEAAGIFRGFAADALERAGALVERIEPEGLEVFLPSGLQQAWRADELLRLGFGSELPAEAARVSLESDWLDRFGRLLGDGGRRLRLALSAPASSPADPERLLERRVSLVNAVYRFAGSAPAWTRYLILVFRYTAMSDEKREGVIRIGVNLLNGSPMDDSVEAMISHALDPDAISTVTPATRDLPPHWTSARLNAWLQRELPGRVEEHLRLFLQGLQRRLDRDLARVYDYYDGLQREAAKRLKRQNADEARERLRIEAAAREYQSKLTDLRQRYDLHAKVELIQTLDLAVPVQRLQMIVKRRKGERRLALDWNPIIRQLEPLPCEWGDARQPMRTVCDDALHLTTPAGCAPCPDCGREYCRACHPRQCPRCRLR